MASSHPNGRSGRRSMRTAPATPSGRNWAIGLIHTLTPDPASPESATAGAKAMATTTPTAVTPRTPIAHRLAPETLPSTVVAAVAILRGCSTHGVDATIGVPA